jgi:hypothetical protein
LLHCNKNGVTLRFKCTAKVVTVTKLTTK